MASNETPLEFSCSCGQFQGHIASQAVRGGTRVVCYCRDCRAAELYFKQPDPAPGPVDLFQTTPDAIVINKGADLMGLLRLSPRGPMRWYATCCNVPLFNTAPSSKLPLVGIKSETLAELDRIGPVVGKVFMPREGGKPTHKGMARIVWGIATRMLVALLSGRWRKTPFFDVQSGQPMAKAVILTKEERAALYPPQRNING